MNQKKINFLRAIGDIDEEFIARANGEQQGAAQPHSTHWVRWAAPVAVCLVIVGAVGLLSTNDLLQKGGLIPSVGQSNGSIQTTIPEKTSQEPKTDSGALMVLAPVKLNFNAASEQISASDIYIPLHFWHQLNEIQLDAVFHGVDKVYDVSAVANFNGETMELVNIDAQIISPSWANANTGIYVQIAKGDPLLCYHFDTPTQDTDVYDTMVTAGVWDGGKSGKVYFAEWKIGDIGYYAELKANEVLPDDAETVFSELVSRFIFDGSADLNGLDDPETDDIPIPELLSKSVTLSEAQGDADFGKYIPKSAPIGFVYESGMRTINQDTNNLFVSWSKDLSYLTWQSSEMTTEMRGRLTSVDVRENYDLSLYPIPMSESVPERLKTVVYNPIFNYDEMTLDTVYARSRYTVYDAGEPPSYHMDFGVLIGNTMLEINAKGASPEDIWEMLQSVME